jgi:hypothetical protein
MLNGLPPTPGELYPTSQPISKLAGRCGCGHGKALVIARGNDHQGMLSMNPK